MFNQKYRGFGKYLLFGLREEWLQGFLKDKEKWFDTTTAGSIQKKSVIVWLKDAELLEPAVSSKKEKKATPLCYKLEEISTKEYLLVWEIIWINLYYNSSVVKWYVDEFPFNIEARVKDIIQHIIQNSDHSYSERTISSGIGSLLNMFDNSPYNEDLNIGVITKKGNIRYVTRKEANNIHPLSLGYFLYKKSESDGRKNFTISDFKIEPNYFNIADDDNINKLVFYSPFGVSKDIFSKLLYSLQIGYGLVNIISDSNMEISLVDGISSEDVILKFENS